MLLFYLFVMIPLHYADSWRYSHSNNGGLPTPRDMVSLEYSGVETDVIGWETDEMCCVIANISSPSTYVQCSKAGLHSVTLRYFSDGEYKEESKYITIVDHPYAFHWYVQHVEQRLHTELDVFEDDPHYHAPNDGADYQEPPHVVDAIRLWVTDTHYQSMEEQCNNATNPSPYSKLLSVQLASLGEWPEITVLHTSPYSSLHAHHYVAKLQHFVPHNGYWEAIVHSVEDSVLQLAISGQHISLNDCFVSKTTVAIPRNVIMTQNNTTMAIVYYHGNAPLPKIIKDPCSPNVALLINRDGAIKITQNDFQTTEQFVVEAINGVTEYHVKDITFTRTDVVMHVNNHLLLMNKQHGNAALHEEVVPLSVQGISGASVCMLNIGQVEGSNDLVVLWTNTSILYTYHVTDDGFTSALPPSSVMGDTTEIIRAAVGNVPHTILVLTFSPILEESMVLQFNVKLNEWTEQGSIQNVMEPVAGILYLSRVNSFLSWSSYEVHFFNGSVSSQISLNSMDSVTVSSVLVDPTNPSRICVVLNSSQLLYGSLISKRFVKLNMEEHLCTDCALMYDHKADLYAVNAENGQLNKLPLENELYNVDFPNIFCINQYFSQSNVLDIKFLDKTDSLNADVESYETSGDTLQVTLNAGVPQENVDKLTLSSVLDEGSIFDKLTINIDVNKSSTDFQSVSAKDAQVSSLFVSTTQDQLTCMHPSASTSLLYTGCPPTRHMEVIRTSVEDVSYCNQFRNFTATIPGNQRPLVNGSSEQEDLVFSYDYHTFGCPIRMHNGELLMPRLMLYDDELSVGELHIPFVLYELHDAQGFTYLNTSGDMGCTCPAQTWSNMMEAYNHSSGDQHRELVWGPHNYVSCFRDCYTDPNDSEKPAFMSTAYEIFTGNDEVALELPQEYDGLFLFKVLVIDPDFSYCSLSTVFAVEVHGALPEVDLALIGEVVLTCILFVLFSLFFSYIYLRHRMYDAGNKEFEFPEDEESE